LGTFLDDLFQMEARALIRDLRDHPMQVVLMPAPDPQHVGHMIRVVISRPPDWYMERFYSGRGRKTFKRHRFVRALQRVAEGRPIAGAYQKDIIKFLKEKFS
jgi:hypothetical protein